MAPEQILRQQLNARTDQFSFCVVLYELLYGKRPFGSGSMKNHFAGVLGVRDPDPPTDADVPGWIFNIIARGLSVKPADRWPSMAALLEELLQDPEADRLRKRRLLRRRTLTALLVAVAIVGPLAVWYRLGCLAKKAWRRRDAR